MKEQRGKKSDIPVLILAGGASSRMGGRDKLLEPVDGLALLRAQVIKAMAVARPVTVALPPKSEARQRVLHGLDVAVMEAPDHGEGLGGTLRNGLAAFAGHPLLCLLLADLPEITARDLAAVLAAPLAHPEAEAWRGTTSGGAPGHPLVLSETLIAKGPGLSGDIGARELLKQAAVHPVPLPREHARQDLDTPEAWAAWRRRTGR